MLGAAGDLDGSRRGGVQSTEVVEKMFIAEHGGQAQPGEHAMSSRAQHYREAERLREALPPDKRGRHAGDEGSGADAGGGPGARHAGHRAR